LVVDMPTPITVASSGDGSEAELDAGWFAGAKRAGVTAGASTRDGDILAVADWLKALT
jgi:4-hydroxy-3-methylbut-2-enyl diphosphate reductase IspH